MSQRAFLLLALPYLAGAIGCTPLAAADPEGRNVQFFSASGKPAGPFSPAVRVGKTLYLSGQIGVMPGTNQLAPGGIEGETRQTLDNIKDVLIKSGSSMNQVVKCTVLMADISELARMNAVYAIYFPNDKPTRKAFGANGLVLGARVEIECLAVLD